MAFLLRALLVAAVALLVVSGRASAQPAILAGDDTFAEMRTIKGEVTVTPAGEGARAPYPRERLAEGAACKLSAGGLAWLRRDAGAILLVAGPAQLTFHHGSIAMTQGKAFVDTNDGPPTVLDTPHGRVELSDARASAEIHPDGTADVYVLRGSARAGSAARANPGEMLTVKADGSSTRAPEVAWDDWTGGLATADRAAEPAPFGVGTVGARPPGDQGKPRFSLVVQRLDVNVFVDHDFAVTEVDETFVNPSSATVEGLFSFRTPPGATLQRFGVDRHGEVVWGRIKESAAALAQYQSNVYAGSTEDPALLVWTAPGVYSARLYPIQPGAQRRVVTRYSEWLPRQGPKGDRRLYVYPMAAEGARGSLPRIEELTISVDLARSGAERVRTGMGGVQETGSVVIKAFDVVPLADVAVELLDGGQTVPVAYRAPHGLTQDEAPELSAPDFAARVSREEPDYLLVPVRTTGAAPPPEGIDLALVVDTSAATEAGALGIARNLASALLAQLGPSDRAALWSGDAKLHPVVDGSGALTTLDDAKRRAWLEGLAAVDRGGATDLGALLTDAAAQLDPKRRGAVVYVGDGQPSVGELAPQALRDRLARLPQGTRIFTAALGSHPNSPLLQSIARGAPMEVVSDAYGAASAALRLLEAAYRPTWVGATVDLGAGVERVFPRDLPAVGPDDGVLVVGRIVGATPAELTVSGGGQTLTRPLHTVPLADFGDLRRRWGEGRLQELLESGSGRAAVVDVGRRYGVVSPFTSLYVPTERETVAAGDSNLEDERESRMRRWKPWWHSADYYSLALAEQAEASADDKEGGTGTRAKGEEGSMGNPNTSAPRAAYGVPGPSGGAGAAMKDAAQFGMIGLLDQSAAAPWGQAANEDVPRPSPTAAAAAVAPAAPAPPPMNGSSMIRPGSGGGAAAPAAAAPSRPPALKAAEPTTLGNAFRSDIGDAFGAGGLGLSGDGEAGGGRGQGMGTGQGIGSGHGRLDGNATAPQIRESPPSINGRLPPEVVQRIVRQNFGRFRLCYENAARSNPSLRGRVAVRFIVDRTGAVATSTDVGSDLPDASAVACIARGFSNLSFPEPDGGGTVTVVYPLLFAPGGDGSTSAGAAWEPMTLASLSHVASPCSAAADLPFDDRQVLWRERLGSASSASSVLAVYTAAVGGCEAPSWRERSALLVAMVNRLGSIRERVSLWRQLLGTPAAADVVYRTILARVQTASDLKELHDSLGLRSVDPQLLAGLLAKAKTPADRASVLHAIALKFSDDLELALRVLDAFEDAGDDPSGRAWARRMRKRADASAHVFTNLGEYYLRLSKRGTGPAAERDADEARRTFGELVEFAPDDPLARRRLGDLLRAHGWYDEAFRQYETLAQLTPDDPAVPLLLATAAQGMGRIEEAVSWAEKAASAGSPDGTSPVSKAARATASAFLAWAREEALAQHKADDADRLLGRARRVAGSSAAPASSVRFLVTWSHPELHPILWTTALGAPMPATDSFPLFGVAEATLPASPDPVVELRLDPEDAARAARLGVAAVVTAISGEGTADEKVARFDVTFGDPAHGGTPRVLVRLSGGELHAEVP
jgi:Ca-activated chloride channel family protein